LAEKKYQKQVFNPPAGFRPIMRQQFEEVANQLRKPNGVFGQKIASNMNIGNAVLNRNTIVALDLKGNEVVLEIGMGNGFFVREIASVNNAVNYIGCDFSQLMVDESVKLNEDLIRQGRAKFYLNNGHDLPFDNNSFDKVFTINTIYFWDNPALILAEIKRVLKPGGDIIIAGRPKQVMQTYPFVKFGFQLYEKEDVANLLAENGFTINAMVEKEEPPQEMDGLKVALAGMIISANK
jgi:ubiquinone/menaquinone biosynthesis C-methylase UbiE